jgi:hypothetical protein
MKDSRDPKPWLWRGAFFAALALGWLFIAWKNHFHISAPLVFVCLGYLAVVATVANLWRTGAAAVTGDEQESDSTWAKPAGALGELEREKRTLLKAIKEAEFDHQMGKLSQLDVDDMIRTYRARAIEVIKEIDRLETGATGTPREQIMREVRARIELEAKSQKKPDPKAATFVPAEAKPTGEPATVDAAVAAFEAAVVPFSEMVAEAAPDAAADAKAEAAGDAAADAKLEVAGDVAADANVVAAADPKVAEAEARVAEAEAKVAEAKAKVAEAKAVAAAADAAKVAAKSAKAEAKSSKKKAAAKLDAKTAASLEDEGMDADSTTSVEPKRNDPAKEATP